ncbi:glycosyltransferase family 87 protein [Hydrogenophaga sp.]|uniref:glycosyltransferase family 87 protein n=1 Tax=Hydrogenophaga sp. TaxID=1904254 RepID=UPI00261B2472|nr:glycosyltransferase family 87 protein [Hydrogenophaga sp.]MCW5653223.1 DUF2029 domain-containing protein [Hydrogenophaga sp.]
MMGAWLAHSVHLLAFAAGLAVLLAWGTRERQGTAAFAIGALAMAGLMAVAVFAMSDPKGLFEDFREAYLEGGIAVRESREALAPLFEKGINGFVNLPIVAYLFWPFAFLPFKASAVLFSLIGLACAFGAWVTLVRGLELQRRSAALLLLAFAASGPLIYSVREGNISHFLLWPLAVAMLQLRRGQDLRAGCLLGALAVIKLPFLLFGVYYFLRGRWRVALGGAVVCALAVLASLAVFGWETHVRWYELCIKPYGQDPMPAFNVQSIQAFVLRLQVGAQGLFLWEVTPLSGWGKPLSAAWVVLLYAGVFLWLWRTRSVAAALPASRPSGSDTEFMLVLALACVTSPLSWSHYFCWFLLPAAHFFQRLDEPAIGTDRMAQVLGWFALVATSIPVISIRWPPQLPALAEAYARTGTSLVLAGGLAWMAWLACQRRPPA